jgi:hypothetical protein
MSNANALMDMFKVNLMMNTKEGNPIWTFVTLLVLEIVTKYVAQFVETLKTALDAWVAKKFKNTMDNLPLTESVEKDYEIVFVRKFGNKSRWGDDQLNVDAVLAKVVENPNIRRLVYSRAVYIVNYKDEFMINDNIWFQLISSEFDSDAELETIKFRIFVKNLNTLILKKFVADAIQEYELRKKYKLGTDIFYMDHYLKSKDHYGNVLPEDKIVFTRTLFQTNRNLDNVFFPQKKEVQTRLELFLTNKSWYAHRGIPHTLGFLLHGPPGCGKTSVIKAIANMTGRHILNINLGKVKTKTQLKQMFYDERIWIMDKGTNASELEAYIIPIDKRLYVMEDVDATDGSSVLFRRDKKDVANNGAQTTANASQLSNPAPLHDIFFRGGTSMSLTGMASMGGLGSGISGAKEPEPYGSSMYQGLGSPIQSSGNTSLLPKMPSLPGQQEDTDPNDKLDLSAILNILDGTLETPGRILIITSNYPEKLDHALIRPGRIDMIIEFEKAKHGYIQEMHECFYGTRLSDDIVQQIKEDLWTPAEVNQILFKNYENPAEAVKTLIEEDPKKYFHFSYFGNKDEPAETSTQPKITEAAFIANETAELVAPEPAAEKGEAQKEAEAEPVVSLELAPTDNTYDTSTVLPIADYLPDATPSDKKADFASQNAKQAQNLSTDSSSSENFSAPDEENCQNDKTETMIQKNTSIDPAKEEQTKTQILEQTGKEQNYDEELDSKFESQPMSNSDNKYESNSENNSDNNSENNADNNSENDSDNNSENDSDNNSENGKAYVVKREAVEDENWIGELQKGLYHYQQGKQIIVGNLKHVISEIVEKGILQATTSTDCNIEVSQSPSESYVSQVNITDSHEIISGD